MRKRKLYSAAEDAFIWEHYRTTPHKDIARHLERTLFSVRKRADRLGLLKPIKRWTETEDEFIRDNIGGTLTWVAKNLGRNYTETSERARKLGLQFQRTAYHEHSGGYLVKRTADGNGGRKSIFKHVETMEVALGRNLVGEELVHHIDCNKRNNELCNLHLCANKSTHGKAHRSIEKLLSKLIGNGVVYFDRNEGVYKLCETSSPKPV